MRLAILSALVLSAPVLADISSYEMRLGDSGKLGVPASGYTIAEVGDSWIAVQFRNADDRPTYALIRGIPTTGLVDDRKWTPVGDFKVTKTDKYMGKTVFVIEAVKEPKKK